MPCDAIIVSSDRTRGNWNQVLTVRETVYAQDHKEEGQSCRLSSGTDYNAMVDSPIEFALAETSFFVYNAEWSIGSSPGS